jgi:hypothetical protein
MKKMLVGLLLAVLYACSADGSKRAELHRVATSQEMQVVLALVDGYRAEDEAYGKYSKRKVGGKPIWSRMLPLHVLRTNDEEQKHPSFDGFAVPLKALVNYTENSSEAFNLQDSTYLFQQVSKTEILLDSITFKHDTLLTPQLYKQLRVRRKIHNYGFYQFSQPLFSSDGNSAYIQVDAAGSRTSYWLLKKQGKWTVTHALLFWVV